MAQSRLIELSYFDPHTSIRLTTYADTIVTDYSSPNRIISAVRFGGYPEVVKAMSDAIYGGATIDVCSNGETLHLDTVPKGYRRQLSHDGIYAAATLMANDDPQSPDQLKEDAAEDDSTEENKPRKCYIFCPAGDQDRLFEEVDRKTAAPLIPEFRDYVLRELIRRGELRRMEVFSVKEKMDAWVLSLLPEDKNVVQVLEDGLKTGQIAIPGATPGAPDGFAQVENVTSYLSTYGITVADRIRKQFIPLFDPASEPLSDEVLAINRYIQQKAGYSLYDAQLAVAEATKRQLQRCGTALIVAECGSGKTKIGTDALGALYGLGAAQGGKKTFNLVMAPSHVTKKWVREIGETLPNTFAMVVKSITDLNRLYDMYQNCPQSVFAVFSKERARDGYMRYPAVQWNRRKKAFLCPDCMEPVEMEISEDGTRYTVNADQFFFQKEHKRNHKCRRCGAVLWAPVVPGRQIDWIKIPEYGWIYRYRAGKHLMRTQNEAVLDQLTDMPMAVITDVIRIAGRLLSELPLPQTIDLSERAVLLTEQEPYFRLNVAALESESTEDGVWLDLPMQNGALEQLMLHLDVQDTDELEIRGLSGVVSPDDLELGEYEIFLADIHDYDAFARTLMECVPIHAMAKYKALLLARPTSIQGATKLATRLSCYEFFRYAELQDLLQEHKLHMDCRTLADHLNFDETNYGFIRYRLGHNLDVELDTIRLMENAKTEDAFWNATKYLFGRNSPDSFQRWIAFVDRQVESNQYADNFPSAFPPNPAFTAQFWLGSLLAAFYQVAEQYGDEIAFKIWSCPYCYPPHQLLALAEHLKEGGMIEGSAQKDFGPDGLPLPFPMLADVLPADSPYWEEDPAAAVERIRQEQIAQNRAQLRTDLASGTRQLWDLEQELQGRAGTFPGWLQGAYEVNEDFEQSLGEVIAELCETFQEIKRRYGIEIARELYNEHPVILSSELPGAAQFLSLGGSCGGAAELAGVGFFMPEEDITEAEMARAAAYMNAGGNASEVYKAIEQNG